MPLKCFNSNMNENIHAFDMTSDQWKALEDLNRSLRHLRMPCCSSQVTLRRSRLGTQFFAHKAKGTCETAPETEIHLRLKNMAVIAARAHGWEAETEASGAAPSGEPWRADVLATKGKSRVAIEVQWSSQTNEETQRRQARYAASGIRGLWLLRQSNFPIDQDLPAARIEGNLSECLIAAVPTGADEQLVPMDVFLEAAFSKRLRFGIPLGVRADVSVRAGNIFCWSCGAQTKIITGIDIMTGPYNYGFIPLKQVEGSFPNCLRRAPSQGAYPVSTRQLHCPTLLPAHGRAKSLCRQH